MASGGEPPAKISVHAIPVDRPLDGADGPDEPASFTVRVESASGRWLDLFIDNVPRTTG